MARYPIDRLVEAVEERLGRQKPLPPYVRRALGHIDQALLRAIQEPGSAFGFQLPDDPEADPELLGTVTFKNGDSGEARPLIEIHRAQGREKFSLKLLTSEGKSLNIHMPPGIRHNDYTDRDGAHAKQFRPKPGEGEPEYVAMLYIGLPQHDFSVWLSGESVRLCLNVFEPETLKEQQPNHPFFTVGSEEQQITETSSPLHAYGAGAAKTVGSALIRFGGNFIKLPIPVFAPAIGLTATAAGQFIKFRLGRTHGKISPYYGTGFDYAVGFPLTEDQLDVVSTLLAVYKEANRFNMNFLESGNTISPFGLFADVLLASGIPYKDIAKEHMGRLEQQADFSWRDFNAVKRRLGSGIQITMDHLEILAGHAVEVHEPDYAVRLSGYNIPVHVLTDDEYPVVVVDGRDSRDLPKLTVEEPAAGSNVPLGHAEERVLQAQREGKLAEYKVYPSMALIAELLREQGQKSLGERINDPEMGEVTIHMDVDTFVSHVVERTRTEHFSSAHHQKAHESHLARLESRRREGAAQEERGEATRG